jgi:polyisoprenyl-teichoic acid--peptidoglycan teichoic acid transferase
MSPSLQQPALTGRGDLPVIHKKKNRWLPVLVITVAAVIAAGVFTGALYIGSLSRDFSSNVRRQDLFPETKPGSGLPPRPAKVEPGSPGYTGAVNYVIMGSDTRPGGAAQREDVVMVLHLTGDRKTAYLISLPHQMYVDTPGRGNNEIGAVYGLGGPQLTIPTVEDLLDIPMDHAIVGDVQGLVALTQDLGGVRVDNKVAFRSRSYYFPAGWITVKGDQALAYVSNRDDLPRDPDNGRRQRSVVEAVLSKGLSADTMVSPATFGAFVTAVSKNMIIDKQFTDTQILATAVSLRLTGEDLHSFAIPSTKRAQKLIPDPVKLNALRLALRQDKVADYLARYPNN